MSDRCVSAPSDMWLWLLEPIGRNEGRVFLKIYLWPMMRGSWKLDGGEFDLDGAIRKCFSSIVKFLLFCFSTWLLSRNSLNSFVHWEATRKVISEKGDRWLSDYVGISKGLIQSRLFSYGSVFFFFTSKIRTKTIQPAWFVVWQN